MGIVDLKDDLEEACAQFGFQSYSGEEMLCGCQRCSGSSVVVGVWENTICLISFMTTILNGKNGQTRSVEWPHARR